MKPQIKINGETLTLENWNDAGNIMCFQDGRRIMVEPVTPPPVKLISSTITAIETVKYQPEQGVIETKGYQPAQWFIGADTTDLKTWIEAEEKKLTVQRNKNRSKQGLAPVPLFHKFDPEIEKTGPLSSAPVPSKNLFDRVLLYDALKNENHPEQIHAVAWVKESEEPVLLKTFQEIEKRIQPEQYFSSYNEAAQYIGKSTRTIRNWIDRGWLNVKKDGKLIQISKTDLDKCGKRK